MALYVHSENQTLLWNIIHKNPAAQQFFLKIYPPQKEQWFKVIIQKFYNENQARQLTIPELQQINRDTLGYMLNDIRNRGEKINSGKSVEEFTPKIESNSNKSIATPQLNKQFTVLQKEYANMFEIKTPENINFKDNIEDQPISNMDELVKIHMKQREEELHIYAPQQNVIPSTNSGQQLTNNTLKIDPSSPNIKLVVESFADTLVEYSGSTEEPNDKKKKSVSWTANENIPSSSNMEKNIGSNQRVLPPDILETFIEQQNMLYAEFESFKIIIHEMTRQIKLLQDRGCTGCDGAEKGLVDVA